MVSCILAICMSRVAATGVLVIDTFAVALALGAPIDDSGNWCRSICGVGIALGVVLAGNVYN